MRDPYRIPFVLRELQRLWEKHPDWRLGQLVFNIPGRDPFHIEDYDLIKLGYEKFGGDSQPDTSDFPEYWIDPNAFKELIHDINTGKFKVSKNG